MTIPGREFQNSRPNFPAITGKMKIVEDFSSHCGFFALLSPHRREAQRINHEHHQPNHRKHGLVILAPSIRSFDHRNYHRIPMDGRGLDQIRSGSFGHLARSPGALVDVNHHHRSPPMTYGQQLREARRAAGLTQAQAGHLLGYCRSSIQKYETGRCVPPPRSRQWLLKILNEIKL